MIVDVIVAVDVIDTVIVAALVNGNDTVGVIDAVSDVPAKFVDPRIDGRRLLLTRRERSR